MDFDVYALLNKKLKGVASGIKSISFENGILKFTTNDNIVINVTVPNMHTHSNQAILDKLNVVDGKLYYEGVLIDGHEHSNKATLDGITNEKVSKWDNKSEFSGRYNDLTGMPTEFKPSSHRHDASEIDNLPTGSGGSSVVVVDNLTSTSTTSALSANQGRVIKSSLDNIVTRVSDLESNTIIASEWSGKIASFLGDSITYGTNTTKIYHDYLKELIGFSICNNYGVDGASITNHSNGICDRYNIVDKNSDIVFVFAGTNDFYYNKPLGEWYLNDNGNRKLNTDNNTFKGALNNICYGLIDKFPNKEIILMTPIHRYTFQTQQTEFQPNANGLFLEDYVNCMKEAGKIFSIKVIDLYSESGLYPFNDKNATLYFNVNDKLHPNSIGHLKIAKIIQNKLKTISFINIQFEAINVTGVTLNKSTTTIVNGATEQLIATVLPSNATNKNITWSSSNTSVATVSASGLVTGVGAGSANITVTTADGSKTATCGVTISSSSISVTSIALNKSTSTLTVPNTEQLTVTFTPSNATNKNVTWSSSDNAKATVVNGLVTSVGEGSVTITATSVDGNKVASCSYTISTPATPDYQLVSSNEIEAINATLVDTNKLTNLTNQWACLKLKNILNNNYKMKLSNAPEVGQLIWYVYKVDSSYIYVVCIGSGNGEHGKLYKLSRGSSDVVANGTVSMPYIPILNDVIFIEVSNNSQSIYCNSQLLLSLSECNAIGAAAQNQYSNNKILFTEFMKK